jgi:hypothetical protein
MTIFQLQNQFLRLFSLQRQRNPVVLMIMFSNTLKTGDSLSFESRPRDATLDAIFDNTPDAFRNAIEKFVFSSTPAGVTERCLIRGCPRR